MNDFWFWILLAAGCSIYVIGWLIWGKTKVARHAWTTFDRSLMVREKDLDAQVRTETENLDKELYRLLYGSSS
jgi:hypothetical protein